MIYTAQDIENMSTNDLAALRIKLRIREDRGTFQADCTDTEGKRKQPSGKTRLEAVVKALRLMGHTVEDAALPASAARKVETEVLKDYTAYQKGSLMQGYVLACRDKWTEGQRTSVRTRREALEIVQWFGGRTHIREMDYNRIYEYINALRYEQELENGTINRRLSKLSVILRKCAQQVGVLDLKTGFMFDRLPEAQGRMRWFTQHEESAIIAWFMENELPDYADFVQVSIDTGARCGELLSLEWRDVQLASEQITVSTYKTRGSVRASRTVPLTARARSVLERRRIRGLSAPFGNFTQDQLSHYWRRMRKALGFENDPEFIPHVMRHTCASRLAMRGVLPQNIAMWLGHSSLDMVKRYAKMHGQLLKEDRAKLESFHDPI